MSQVYQPLHHKYRPERFDDLVGQEPIAATLKQALISRRIAPAYLFSGPRGTGKTSSARILARSLNCLKSDGPTTEPCGTCDLCRSITNGSSLDVIEIDAASNTGVENIRELIERSRFAPVQARWKVYVVDECHMLSTAAFNALLKTLEEPPARVVFVLATTDPQRVLPTILSRCQRFDFRRIPIEAVKQHLTLIASQEAIAIETEALALVAQRAQGGLRDAESMLDQLSLLPQPIKTNAVWDLLGAVPEKEIISLASALAQRDPIELLENSRRILDRGKDPLAILQGLASILRDLVLINVAPKRPELTSVSQESQQELNDIAKDISLEQLLRWQAQLKGTESHLRHSVQPRLWLEVLLLGIIARSGDDANEVIAPKRLIKNASEDNRSEGTNQNLSNIKNQIDSSQQDNVIDNRSVPEEKVTASLNELWEQILGRLELPSTRMLLSQQAKLVQLNSNKAFINVAGNWIGMVQSRVKLIEQAVQDTLGSPREIILEEQKELYVESKTNKPYNESLSIPKSKGKEEPSTQANTSISQFKEAQINTTKTIIKDQDNTSKENITESIDQDAKRFAEFFNGKILEEDIND